MKIEIRTIIEVDEKTWCSDAEELEWFKDVLNDKENTFIQLWSNDIGDEIGCSFNFKYKIL
jgi:hypothetical protein